MEVPAMSNTYQKRKASKEKSDVNTGYARVVKRVRN